MTTTVIINDLDRLPHASGQVVLQCERDDFRVTVTFSQGAYWVHGCVRTGGYTNPTAQRLDADGGAT